MSRKTRAAAFSVASNATLVVLKLVVGLLSGSVSILSEAIHSANDLLAAIIAFFSVRVSDRPPDAEHPYGHGKIESISGAIEAGLIILAAVWIVVEAIRKMISGGAVEHLEWGMAIMLFSVLLNVLVSRYLFKVARQEDSLALEADAQHLATDIYTSMGVAVGLGLVWLTDWHIIDPLVAIAVAILISRVGWKLTRDAVGHLMDHGLPAAEISRIEQLLRDDPRVRSWHDLRTRKSGSERHIDVHIVLREDATLVEANQVADDLEQKFETVFPRCNVVIHPDPYDDSMTRRQTPGQNS
ncbi:MAG: cation diffusion facilitator family transporter [Candidatus Zixiibacteriota bacterium]